MPDDADASRDLGRDLRNRCNTSDGHCRNWTYAASRVYRAELDRVDPERKLKARGIRCRVWNRERLEDELDERRVADECAPIDRDLKDSSISRHGPCDRDGRLVRRIDDVCRKAAATGQCYLWCSRHGSACQDIVGEGLSNVASLLGCP